MGAPPQDCTARDKTHHGGSFLDAERSKSLRQSTRHRLPVTGQPGTGLPVTGQPGTGQVFTSQQITSHRSLSDYQAPGTRQLITRHQSLVNQSLGIGHQSVHQALVITHQTSDKNDPVANKINRSSEQLFPRDPQNSSASKRVLLPLEPDFSQMSDPSIIIAPPSNTWVSEDKHTSSRHSRRDLPKNRHNTKQRRRYRSLSSSSSSRSSSDSHKRDKRSKRSKYSHEKKKAFAVIFFFLFRSFHT